MTSQRYADVLTEVRRTPGSWRIASPRLFSTAEPVADAWEAGDVSWWLTSPSLREQWGRRG